LEEAHASVKLGVFQVEDHTKPNNYFSHYNAYTSSFLSHTDIRIILLCSYLHQSTLVYPPNISHAYREKSLHIPPYTCDRIPLHCRPSYSEHSHVFHGYCNRMRHPLPQGAHYLIISPGSINRRAPKAFAHRLFILHALC
jgi:hypothetical protein